ncbi:hypothetical protein NXT08_00770 [Rhodococcus pyridinivorans]|uniref:Uncharacterized protein n=9 Tax=Rhodococcus TaxID=1827 RepID=A0A379LW44_9NOCA|nr:MULTISPECIES: hypothetical protein [Rhodococcus]KLL96511.1 hypothetical protein NJ76_01145 [Rhodococcus sp. IITR03]AOD23420.1 hypothetical protein IM25_19075 [Rhodococcus sp. p52]APE09435.1 hypothetical protein BO226_09650 [Rhodococcus sp. 2G]AWZ25415.1 hypothetical protein CEJ39_15700 [Rhodococcus pyridinivorans]AYA26696.1 hypothetical protein C6369_021155 [Rhodococcus rhodochrous]
MRSSTSTTGRHRLGMENGVHCILIPEVAAALAEHRRNWFTALLTNARHSHAAMRKRATALPAQWATPAVG